MTRLSGGLWLLAGRLSGRAEREYGVHPDFGTSTLLVVLLASLVTGAEVLLSSGGGADETARSELAVALALPVAAGLWLARRPLYLVLTSLPFSVVLLTSLLLATAAGTLVLQQAAPAEYAARYGRRPAAALLALGLNDVFHTPWFRSLLVLLASSLLLVPVRNRAWQLPRLGHLFAHVGVVVILAGGLIGQLGGLKGTLELREGQSADHLVRTDGPAAGERVPLGFALALLDFSVERHDDAWRLHLYEPDGASWRLAGSWPPEAGATWAELGAGLRFRVEAAFPDVARRELREVATGQGAPWLSLPLPRAGGGRRTELTTALGRDSMDLPDAGGTLRFCWDEPSAAAEPAAATPARHLVAPRDGASPPFAVAPGGRYVLADGTLVEVLRFLPHFQYDIAARTAHSLSSEPRNPALEVAVTPPGAGAPGTSWLFAGHRDERTGHAGAPLDYEYEPARAPPERETLVVGSTREAWRLQRGALVAREPLAQALPEASVLPSAVEEVVSGRLADGATDPALRLAVDDGRGVAMPVLLSAADDAAFRLPGRDALLVLEKRGDDIKSFASRVTVLQDGRPVAEQVIRVNEPLNWGGFAFYQSSWRQQDPSWTGLQVVRDPGLPLVFTGFVLLAVGVAYVYSVRTWLLRRRAA